MHSEPLLPGLKAGLLRHTASLESPKRRNRSRFAIAAVAVALSGTATAVAGEVFDVWNVSPNGNGGVCAQDTSRGFCVESSADIEAGKAFVVEYQRDTLISADPQAGTAKVAPGNGAGQAHGIEPTGAAFVEVHVAGNRVFETRVDRDQHFDATVPPQGTPFEFRFLDSGGSLVANSRVP